MSSGLEIAGLTVRYRTPRGHVMAVRDVSLRIAPGEVLGLVGESGSGKSTLAYAIVSHLPENAGIAAGRVTFAGRPLVGVPRAELARVRGNLVGMVYQDPSTALNPAMRLGHQIQETLIQHERLTVRQARARTRELLAEVQLPDPAFIMARFPHEVSGGEKQRVLIAMAFACRPRLIIFDEPTTALDATTAASILDLIQRLQRETSVAALFITHDLGVVARVSQRLAVIYAGSIVEEGPTASVLRTPRHFYTRLLMASVPNPFRPGPRRRLPVAGATADDANSEERGCRFAARCPAVIDLCRTELPALAGDGTGVHLSRCLRAASAADYLPATAGVTAPPRSVGKPLLTVRNLDVEYVRRPFLDQLLGRAPRRVSAVADVSLTLAAGETLGLVGESGCGKSTLARALVGLRPFRGRITLGPHMLENGGRPTPAWRRAIQIVFQHPDQSLNPRMRVGEIIARPLILHDGLRKAAALAEAQRWLERVRLSSDYARRYPHELSGGEKQRVAIARAFAAKPELVVCDEITSGLDVSVQASILNLIADLQDEAGTALILISHDLNMVQHVADQLAVMYLGRLVEERRLGGPIAPPMHPYTEALLAAVPVPEPGLIARRVRLSDELPSPAAPPPGCRFVTRCPRRLGPVCNTPPPRLELAGGQAVLCHVAADALAKVPPIWEKQARES